MKIACLKICLKGEVSNFLHTTATQNNLEWSCLHLRRFKANPWSMQLIWFVATWLAHFWDICGCCTYNLMAHWYISFAILILLCRQNLGKTVSSAEPQTNAIAGKDEDKGKWTYCILSWHFWHPRGELWCQQSLTVALRDQVAQRLKDAPLSAPFRLVYV